MLQSRPKQRP